MPHRFEASENADNPRMGDSILLFIAPLLLRWRIPGTAELLAEWAGTSYDKNNRAQLALGILTKNPQLIDQAVAEGLPEAWNAEFIALVEQPSPGFTAACRGLMTGQAADSSSDYSVQVQAAIMLADTGLESVWPTLLAVIEAPDSDKAEAIRTALDLLERHPEPGCREQLLTTLRRIAESGPQPWRRNSDDMDYQNPVRALGALFDLGEPMAELAAEQSLALLQQLSRGVGTWDWIGAINEACRVLTVSLPGISLDKRTAITTSLQELLESPLRIHNYEISFDIAYTTQIRNLLANIR